MYKKLSYEELFNIKTWFINNLKNLFKSQRYNYLKEFLKDSTKEGDCVYFFESNSPVFRIIKENENFYLFDEKEKIQVYLDNEHVNKLNRQLKEEKKLKKQINSNKTIAQSLFESFSNEKYKHIEGKPYLVYDIETVGDINNLKTMKFMLWYSICSNEDHFKSMKYRLVDENSIKKFVDFLLDFDWWIVGYNNIFFDNPVTIYNTENYWDEEINILNQKSLDLFMFIRNLTGKRIWLDKVSSNLTWIGKTLSSGQEWEQYLKEYQKTWSQEAFKKVKSYCKNDVKMTLGVLLYFLENGVIDFGDQQFEYNTSDLVKLGNTQKQTQEDQDFWLLF